MEILFIGMITSSMITTYFSVRVISERANVNKALCTFQEHKRDIHNFMEREMLDETLKKRVCDHYDYNWDNMGGVDTRSLLNLCDQMSLRTDIFMDIYGDTFVECPVLTESDLSLLRVVARALHDEHAARGAALLAPGDVADHLYLVHKGVVTLRAAARTYKLGRGSVFGNLECDQIRSPLAAVARTNVHLLQMKSKVFLEIIDNFPAVVDLLAKHRPNGEMYVISDSKNINHSKKDKKRLTMTLVTELMKNKYNLDIPQLNLIITAISYVSLVAELFNIGFQCNRPALLAVLYVLDVLFLMKIVALVHIPRAKQMKEFRNLRRRYVKGKYFKMDVASCLPVEVFSLLVPVDKWVAYSWLRINRSFRIVTLYKCMVRKRKRLSMNLAASAVFSVFVWFSLFVHAVSCLLYYIGSIEDQRRPGSSWMYSTNGTMLCDNHYLCAVFFVVSSFVHNGVGDIMPRTHTEVILVALLAILSTMVLMIYVGEFSNIVQYHSYRSFTFYSDYLQLQVYLKNNRVSEHLMGVIKKYCLHLWRESRGHQLPHFLAAAPQPLRLQVMSATYLHHLDQHPVFKKCEAAFLRQLAGCFTLYTYNDEMLIVQQNEITDAMYFIHKGSVLQYTELNQSIRVYGENGYFGEGLFRDKPFEHSYRSIHNSQILILYLKDWEYLLKHFPESKATIYDSKFYDRKDGVDNVGDDDSATLVFHRLKSRRPPAAYTVNESMLTDEQYYSKTDDESENKTPTKKLKSSKSRITAKRHKQDVPITYLSSDDDSISIDPAMSNYGLITPVIINDALIEVHIPDSKIETSELVAKSENIIDTEVSPQAADSLRAGSIDTIISTELIPPKSFELSSDSISILNLIYEGKENIEDDKNISDTEKVLIDQTEETNNGRDTDLLSIFESEMELGTVSVASVNQKLEPTLPSDFVRRGSIESILLTANPKPQPTVPIVHSDEPGPSTAWDVDKEIKEMNEGTAEEDNEKSDNDKK